MFWWLTSNSIKSKLFVRKKVEFLDVANFSEISPKILKVAPKFGLLITKLKALLI